MKTKIISMYLPQFHETEENNLWWGKGFTDWVSVKGADRLFPKHNQPRIPLNNNYYDLSAISNIKWQIELAKNYGIYGFAFYHYWFSSNLSTLKKPAELLLEHTEIEFPFCFAWDNVSWIRTWSKFKNKSNDWAPKNDGLSSNVGDGVLAKFEYGTENDWKIHFDYLLQFFRDPRYIKVNNKPVFLIWTYNEKNVLIKMCNYWRQLAKKAGFDDIYLIGRVVPYDKITCFDAYFNYEPQFSAWLNKNIINRVFNKLKVKLGINKLTKYNYDKVWKDILKFAKKNKNIHNILYGGFVDYDDTPRRGAKGKLICGGNAEKFYNYLSELYQISNTNEKEFLFLTAWNEWGEGAYLEPDNVNKYEYLDKIRKLVDNDEKIS